MTVANCYKTGRVGQVYSSFVAFWTGVYYQQTDSYMIPQFNSKIGLTASFFQLVICGVDLNSMHLQSTYEF